MKVLGVGLSKVGFEPAKARLKIPGQSQIGQICLLDVEVPIAVVTVDPDIRVCPGIGVWCRRA